MDLIGSLQKLYLSRPDASEYIFGAAVSRVKCFDKFEQVVRQRRMPAQGWAEWEIEAFVQWLAAMDSNNFPGVIGLGEREGRIYSKLVAKRHYGFAHGMGRSGSLGESQPKAVGSTLMVQLSTLLVADALGHLGWSRRILSRGGLALLPTCTGMSMTLGLLACKRPPRARKVIWLRVDQKSCLKAITAAGLEPIVVEGRFVDDELVTDSEAIEQAIQLHGPDSIHSIVSCVSCFAPRAPDSVVQVGRIAQRYAVPHIINGAYAAFSSIARNRVNNAHFDLLVLSLDKNFLVPVSGAVIVGPLVPAVQAVYPGRAGSAGILDALMTLLEMGVEGLKRLEQQRLDCFALLREELSRVEETRSGWRLLRTHGNDISMAISIPDAAAARTTSHVGTRLFYRNVTGARLVTAGKTCTIDGVELKNWCAHSSTADGAAYLNVAVGVGFDRQDISVFLGKLRQAGRQQQ